jgi:uncharacterized protein YbjT (DUF2867 family)
MPKLALIAGGTGLVGSNLVRLLIESQDYGKVVSVGRRGLGWSNPKLEQIVVDFSDMKALPAELRVDDAFCALGTTMQKAGSREAYTKVDCEAVVNFGRAAFDRGAKTFVVVSALGANPTSRFFYSRVKADTENALRGLRFQTLVILRPSLIVGTRPQHRYVEDLAHLLLLILKPVLIGPLKKYRFVEASTIAKNMLASAQYPKPGTKIIESDQIR